MFELEKNVDMPRPRGGRPEKYPFSQMEAGDSFFIPCDGDCAEVSRRVWDAGYRRFGPDTIGTRVTISQSGQRGVRVWRKD
jgi:hypothetical protein